MCNISLRYQHVRKDSPRSYWMWSTIEELQVSCRFIFSDYLLGSWFQARCNSQAGLIFPANDLDESWRWCPHVSTQNALTFFWGNLCTSFCFFKLIKWKGYKVYCESIRYIRIFTWNINWNYVLCSILPCKRLTEAKHRFFILIDQRVVHIHDP